MEKVMQIFIILTNPDGWKGLSRIHSKWYVSMWFYKHTNTLNKGTHDIIFDTGTIIIGSLLHCVNNFRLKLQIPNAIKLFSVAAINLVHYQLSLFLCVFFFIWDLKNINKYMY